MSRWTVSVVAALIVTVASASVAVQAEHASAAPTPRGIEAPTTPVLSARRVPELVAAPVADARLVSRLNDLFGQAPPDSCLTVAVNGRVVFSRNDTVPLTPASVEKLETAVAVLSKLGGDAVLSTVVKAESVEDGDVDGDLWLVGGGDPLLMTDPYVQHFKHQPVTHTSLEALADQVVAAGVRHVHGSIVGDESRYDTQRYVPQWPARFATSVEIGPMSALMVNGGLATFPPTPEVRVPEETPVDDAATAAADQLTLLLAARGVTVDGAARSGTAPGDARQVAEIDSQPIDQIVEEMLRESDNLTAELLTKELGVHEGRGGTTAAGVSVIHDVLAGRNLPVDGMTDIDGSGLAAEDHTTCSLVQAVLDAEGPSSTIGAGLPVAGQTGTLDVRFLGTPLVGRLHAKTGTLNQATALAGFLQTARGAQLSFAFVMNVPAPQKITSDDVDLEEALGAVLDTYPDAPDITALGPR